MTRPLTAVLAPALLAAALLAGCSDDPPSPAPSAPPAPSASATSTSGTSTSETSAPATPAPSAAGPTPSIVSTGLDTSAVCAFLEQELPVLRAVGSPERARTRFTGDLGLWTIGGRDRQLADGTELDAVGTKQCPATRTQLLTLLATPTLNDALTS